MITERFIARWASNRSGLNLQIVQVVIGPSQVDIYSDGSHFNPSYLYAMLFCRFPLKTVFKFAFIVLVFLPRIVHAQDTSKFVMKENFKREIVVGDKRYRVYNNWVSFGVGPGYHSANPRTQFVLGFNFNFHIKKYYFNLGGLMSGDEFGVWNNYTGHAGFIPWRRETEHNNMAVMGGISYTQGYDFLYAGYYSSNRWDRLGVYAEFQYTKKIQYSVGAGPTFFVDWNEKRMLIGIRLDGYLSGAYRGYVRGAGPKNH